MTQKWTVGQEVLLIPSYNETRAGTRPWITTIESVGRKYLTVLDRTEKYEIIGGREVTNYPGNAHSIRTPEFHARVLRQEAANKRLNELGIGEVSGTRSKLPYSVEKLEAVIKILEAAE